MNYRTRRQGAPNAFRKCEKCGQKATFEVFTSPDDPTYLCVTHTRALAQRRRSVATIDSDEMGRPVGYPRYYELKESGSRKPA